MENTNNKNQRYNMAEVINYFTYKYNGDWDQIYEAIQRKELIHTGELERFQEAEDKEVKYISIIDSDYPENFKSIYMPPLNMYFDGNKKLMDGNNIVSLFGDIDKTAFDKIADKTKVYALKVNKQNIAFVKEQLDNGYKFIMFEDDKFNRDFISNEFKDQQENIVYLSEIPHNSQYDVVRQNFERLLIGASNESIFLNTDDKEFDAYKNISIFEKRKMNVVGNINKEYLSFAKNLNNSNNKKVKVADFEKVNEQVTEQKSSGTKQVK